MRLIDADAMLARLEEWNTSDSTDKALYNFTLHRILEQPTIEPQRKKGYWILVKGSNGKDYHKCSKCLHTHEITGVKNYCAVCGADMRGEN